ncbi:LysR family transcriptional regulator [Hansschlegelia beijingensis]|uniref:LysR family transcriptional regulator n=1 Tax=Hansschlegelia beijingensis TaxID=1133344 RepID=UPI0038187F70
MSEARAPLRYDWNDIVYFLAVARHKNLGRAAKVLRVDHTTVSRRVRELERSLGANLFKRSRTGFTLTEIGTRLMRHAEGMENQANALTETVGVGSDAGGAVRIATMEGIGSFYLTARLGAFRERHPGILVELITDTRTLDLTRREAEIFVTFFRPPGRGLQTAKAGEFRVSLFASEAYLARHGHPSKTADLEAHDFIDFVDEYISVNENKWLSDVYRPANTVFRSTSLVAQYAAVTSGQGIAMLPSFVAANNPSLKPVLPKLSTVRDIWISTHDDTLHVSRIKEVVKFLQRQIQEDQDFLRGGATHDGDDRVRLK